MPSPAIDRSTGGSHRSTVSAPTPDQPSRSSPARNGQERSPTEFRPHALQLTSPGKIRERVDTGPYLDTDRRELVTSIRFSQQPGQASIPGVFLASLRVADENAFRDIGRSAPRKGRRPHHEARTCPARRNPVEPLAPSKQLVDDFRDSTTKASP